MFKNKEKYLIRDNLKRTLSIKYKYLNILNKSLFHNRYLTNQQRLFAFYKLSLKKKSYTKHRNICLKSGHNNSVNKKLILARFQINYLGIVNKLQNFKVNSW